MINSAKKDLVNKTATKPAAKPSPSKTKPVAKKAAATKPVATKKSSKPKVAKVSPSAGLSVEQWVANKSTGWQTKAINKIIEIVREAAKASTVSIKWGQPVFQQGGPFAFVRGAKAHVTMGFWRGAELTDKKGVLEGEGVRMAHVKFKSLEEIDEKMLAAFVVQAVKLNSSKGDPTKRA